MRRPVSLAAVLILIKERKVYDDLIRLDRARGGSLGLRNVIISRYLVKKSCYSSNMRFL